MAQLFPALLVLLTVTTTQQLTQTATIRCPDGFLVVGTSCYFVSDTAHDGATADSFCESNGGRAAIVESPEEMELLIDGLLTQTVYLGVHRKNSFEISLKMDGHSGFTNFDAAEPDNSGGEDCVVAEAASGFTWEDVPCAQSHPVLCKTQATVTQKGSGECAPGSHMFADSACFYVEMARSYNFTEGQEACRARDMQIASVHSKDENSFIHVLSGNKNALWIGLNDIVAEGVFVWTDGTAVDYLNWVSSGTDEEEWDCVCMRQDDALWTDVSCSLRYGLACRGPLVY